MTTPSPSEIRTYRLAAGLTQAQAAAVIGVDRRSWQRWEAGDRAMTPRDLELFVAKTRKEQFTVAQLLDAIRTAKSLAELRRAFP